MLKKFLTLQGVITLFKNEQIEIKAQGGGVLTYLCPHGTRVMAHLLVMNL